MPKLCAVSKVKWVSYINTKLFFFGHISLSTKEKYANYKNIGDYKPINKQIKVNISIFFFSLQIRIEATTELKSVKEKKNIKRGILDNSIARRTDMHYFDMAEICTI